MASISRRRSADKSSDPPTARDLNRARVAVYCRVSSDEQAQAGTIQNQIAFARRYCDLHQLPTAKIYADADIRYTDMFLQAQYHAREQVEVFGAPVGEFGVPAPGPGRKDTFHRLLWLLDEDVFQRDEYVADRVRDGHWSMETAA